MKKFIVLLFLIISFSSVDAQWNKIDLGITDPVNRLINPDSSILILVGDNGLMMKSEDDGQTWNFINSGLNFDIKDIAFHNIGQLYIPAYQKIYSSTDTGNTWSTYSYNTLIDSAFRLYVPTEKNMFAIKRYYDKDKKTFQNNCIFFSFKDKSWSIGSQLNSVNFYNPADMFFNDSMKACVAAEKMFSMTINHFQSPANGKFYHINNPFKLKALHFTDDDNCFAVTNNGIVLRIITPFKYTSKLVWDTLLYAPEYSLNEIFFLNKDTGLVVGDSGVILTTCDGGNTWYQSVTNVTTKLFDITYTKSGVFYVFGENGTLLKTSSFCNQGTFVGIKKSNHDNISVYPNPVVDKLYIENTDPKYQISSYCIFNMLGEKVLSGSFDLHQPFEISLNNHLPGLYYLLLFNKSSLIYSIKFFIK